MLQPAEPVPCDNDIVNPRLFCTFSDGGQRSYRVKVAGSQIEAFPTLLENLDLLYKICWVFDMKYMPAATMIYKLFESYIYKQSSGRIPSSVAELASILQANKSE